jgi:hypothetical protein
VLTMTLRTNGLDWLAQNAGSGNCFTTSGISYRDADGVLHTGGTKDVVNAFVVANMVGKTTATIIAGTNYNGFKAINDGVDLAIGDVAEAADREAAGGTYPQYCVGVAPPPPVGDKPVTGPMEVYVGGGESCPPGAPSVTLDTSAAFAFFKSENYDYIGVGGIQVHNLDTNCRAYFAWEVRVWDGYGYTTCPLTVPEMKEINRYLAEPGGRPLSLKRLDASGTDTIWGSFEVPPTMSGEKTICLSLWGNFDYDALMAELNAEGYYDKS